MVAAVKVGNLIGSAGLPPPVQLIKAKELVTKTTQDQETLASMLMCCFQLLCLVCLIVLLPEIYVWKHYYREFDFIITL